MDLKVIEKVIKDFDHAWIESNIVNYSPDKEKDLINFITNVINDEVERPWSRTMIDLKYEHKYSIIKPSVIRDILFTLMIGGQVASFATYLADKIEDTAVVNQEQ